MVLIGAATWLFAPAIALWALWERSAKATLAEPTVAWAEVAAAPSSVSSEADLLLTWSDPTALVAPQWTGTVQRVLTGVGGVVANGTAICVIDNVRRLAWHTEVPLFRPIARGDRGDDVAALNKFLAARGLSHDDGDTAGASTVRGIGEYAKQIGADAVSAFNPGWLVYLPADMSLAEVEGLVVGAPAPAVGSEIALGKSALASATLVAPVASGSEADPSQAELLPLSGSENVLLGSVSIPLSADGVVESLEALATVAEAAAPGDSRLRVELSTEIPSGALAIPYGAIASDASGTCVARRTDATPEVVAIDLALPGTGRVYVMGPLSPGDEVLIPPRGVKCSEVDQ